MLQGKQLNLITDIYKMYFNFNINFKVTDKLV
jgi:hypothetical protein